MLDAEGKRLMVAARRAYGVDISDGVAPPIARKAFEHAVAFIRRHHTIKPA